METRYLLADKYDLNQSNGASDIPNEVWSLRNKTVWSTVPKAALKSRNTSQRTTCWEFFSIKMYIDSDTYTKRQMTVTSVKLKGGSEGLEQDVEAISVVFMRLSSLLCRGSRHIMHSRWRWISEEDWNKVAFSKMFAKWWIWFNRFPFSCDPF